METFAPVVAQFQQNVIINPFEMKILEAIEGVFQKPYRCCPEVPLKRVCTKLSYLNRDTWNFWTTSSIDIVVMLPDGRAGLTIECQSSHHDSLDAKRRDNLKASILKESNIPLFYVRYAGIRDTYKFWSPFDKGFVYFNFSTNIGYKDMSKLLTKKCLSFC